MAKTFSVYEVANNNYEDALRLAGATVLAYETFGSYQGSWLAKVVLPNGDIGYIHDYYGSCSGCDAFEADLGFKKYETREDAEAAVAAFGRTYFDQLQQKDELIAEFTKQASWDTDADKILEWLNKN